MTIPIHLRALADRYTLHPASTNVDSDLKMALPQTRPAALPQNRCVRFPHGHSRILSGAYAHQPITHRVADCIYVTSMNYRSLFCSRSNARQKHGQRDGGEGMKGADRMPEVWMAMGCSRCHVTLNWTGNRWTCLKCHAYWKVGNHIMQGCKAVRLPVRRKNEIRHHYNLGNAGHLREGAIRRRIQSRWPCLR